MTDTKTLLSALAALALIGCGPLGPGGDDDDASDDDDDATGNNDPIETTIAELNDPDGDIAPGDDVIVTGVITTPYFASDEDDDDNEGGFWIQDGEGPGTGILVFTFPDVVAELEASFGPGDSVTVSGEFDAPFGFNEIKLFSAADVSSAGSGTMPQPHVVDAGDIEGGFADPELYGVLLEIRDTTVDVAGGWDNFFEWEADGAIIDSLFHYADVNAGYAVDFVIGVMHLDFGNAVVIPRWEDDVSFTHPGCESAEDGDLQDLNCGHTGIDSDVELTDVVVISGETWFGDSFYVADPDNALFGGVNVFSIPDLDSIPPIGAVISVEGEYEEFRGNSEIVVFDTDDIDDSGDTTAVEAIALASACDVTEAHEGMLVTVPALTVSQSTEGANFGFYNVDGCPKILVAAEFFADNDVFADATNGPGDIVNLVGVVIDEFDEYSINPRDEFDWDTWNDAR